MKFNDWTFLVGVFFLPVWLVWEMVALWLHSRGVESAPGVTVGTISMVMKARGYQMNALPFFWSAMTAHWWFNWIHTKVWTAPYPAIAFWVFVAATLGLDVWLWNTPYTTLGPTMKIFRAPMVQCLLGFILAYVLFPQGADHDPGWRWW